MMKQFTFFQPAILPVEGAGFLQGGYSLVINVEEKNLGAGKSISLSAVGKNIADRAIGAGSILFWCKVHCDNKTYSLTHKGNRVYK